MAFRSFEYPTLVYGMRGENVRTLQKALNAMGARIEEDGVFGTNTRAAVITFQAQAGLQTDGIVGERTWQVIEENLGVHINFPGSTIPDVGPPEEPWLTPERLLIGGLFMAGVAGFLYAGRTR